MLDQRDYADLSRVEMQTLGAVKLYPPSVAGFDRICTVVFDRSDI